MSTSFSIFARAVMIAGVMALAPCAQAQSNVDIDPEIRVQQLENQLRVLTGQNEELQYRNRRLEEQLRQLQGAAAAAPGAPPPSVAAAPPPNQSYRQPPPAAGYEQQQPAQAPIVQEQAAAPAAPAATGRRRGDAFDPNQSPNAPGAPRALGGGQLPIPAEPGVGAPGGRNPGEPLDLGGPRGNDPIGTLATAPPTQTPRDEFDLGIGYMQRKDYALAEQTMRDFAQKYPSDPLLADSQYWLGESFFQRQLYRDSAEVFLGVTTKFGNSAKAPDSLLRLGQSLAALKEKEAACAALGEVTRKYPRASNGVKQAVDREQKRIKC
jgi:tol-pal system protein YbgF